MYEQQYFKENISTSPWVINNDLVLYPGNIFNKLSFRDFEEPSRAVKREILVGLSRYKMFLFGGEKNLIMGHDTRSKDKISIFSPIGCNPLKKDLEIINNFIERDAD